MYKEQDSCGVGFVCDIKGRESHRIVEWGIDAVKNLTHRGAIGGDGKTGDGAGVLTAVPKKFFSKEIDRLGFSLSDIDNLAVGVFFLYEEGLEDSIESLFSKRGIKPVGWREVPVNRDAAGESALKVMPAIKHLLLDAGDVEEERRELVLFLIRKEIEGKFGNKVYVPSLSSRTIVYKGMLVAPQLDTFYPDLKDPDYESSFALFHQRYSTNTFPNWMLAQPLRMSAHNGEINTIQGNRNWMLVIQRELEHEAFGEEIEKVQPLVSHEESDSASLDRVFELLCLSGFSPEHAINMLIPPAWEHVPELSDEVKAFFEYESLLMKPWDGPAAIAFTDGITIGAHLDRNGLRPARYILTEDGILVLGSEVGMVDLEGRKVVEKGRLGPGDTISVKLGSGKVKKTKEILEELASAKPYKEWIDKHLLRLEDIEKEHVGCTPKECTDRVRRQVAFGYTQEEVKNVIGYMADTGKEPTFSMGDDTPLPPLSEKPKLLFRYFKQRFAQVTNPPIDPIRERLVMSLKMNLGHKRNFLKETPQHAKRLQIDSPVLLHHQFEAILRQKEFKVALVPFTFPKERSYNIVELQDMAGERRISEMIMDALYEDIEIVDFRIGIETIQRRAEEAVRNGAEILILTDRHMSKHRVALPSLLAVSAVVKHLARKGLSQKVSIVVETGEARDTHQMACLIGYGASAVYPYLAYETIKELCEKGGIDKSYEEAILNYKHALEQGLLKIMSKMGISTLNSYHGAQIFDTVCLNKDFVEEFFTGTPVTLEADGIKEIEWATLARHDAAYEVEEEPKLEFGGDMKFRKGGEFHAWSPHVVRAFHKFLDTNDYEDYREFSRLANSQHPTFIRHLLSYKEADEPIPLEQVEPVESILRRFVTGGMSLGALSPEAHEVIAEACNRLGMRSNSGEGGEDPKRYWTIKNSAIKQVASGRFGVTPTYLATAKDIEIKIAQGAKPGEGGQLPGHKVNEYIAKLRHSQPGVTLISPPPHHDIYSIEDLAQLIHDLKQANPEARVCVKLVSETGVGTVAAGVAKAYADVVQVSGAEGGTGASPYSSIKNAGNYWEIGLIETQRVLMENGLRDKIRVRVDGGMRTGKDVVIAALMGAEEFGFGTAAMIAEGCVMARACHLNTCPTGVATQDPKYRAKFKGKVEKVMAYFRAVAQEVREILASMGYKSLDEIVGRIDLLKVVRYDEFPGSYRIKVEDLISEYPKGKPRRCLVDRNDNPAYNFNDDILKDLLPYIEKAQPVEREYEIRNVHRTIPTKLNYYIALKYKDTGLPENTIKLTFRGTAGQSFGAFNHNGLSLRLIGDANDYVGKGMFGGKIVLVPGDVEATHENVIMGNTCLYGAIGGRFFAAGRAGERFAIRNSGAVAVVEGAGHHCCEYMTGGVVVVLGDIGYNVGAGMTGGVAYVLDEDSSLEHKLNYSYVMARRLKEEEASHLRALVEEHYRETSSPRAKEILDNFDRYLKLFWKVIPLEQCKRDPMGETDYCEGTESLRK